MDEREIKQEPSVKRISACPLHFLWDGRGRARRFVRAGFLGVVLAAIIKCGNWMWPALSLGKIGDPILLFAFLIWLYGQAKSLFAIIKNRRIASS